MDQDDSMLSTPSSHVDDDELFPSETTHINAYVAAQTPQNDHLNAAAPGELSPPRSQSISTPSAHTNGFSSAVPRGIMDGGDVDPNTDEDEGIEMKDDGRTLRDKFGADKQKPGAGWKNKKAQEQMQAAWEHLVDKDFDIRQFGDVILQDGKGK